VGCRDGGGEAGDIRSVASGATAVVAAELDAGARVTRGAGGVAVAADGCIAGRGDSDATGTTEPARALGDVDSAGAAGSGLTVAWAFGRAGARLPSVAMSRLKVRTTVIIAASVTTTRPITGEYTGESRGIDRLENNCSAKVRPMSAAPPIAARATRRRSSLCASLAPPTIPPIVAPTIINRTCVTALKTADSQDVSSRLLTQAVRSLRPAPIVGTGH
jgi:hypothetical protein